MASSVGREEGQVGGGHHKRNRGDEEDTSPIQESDLKCPICISLLVDPFITPCGHAFCHTCVTTHLEHAHTCPACSSPLTKDRLYPSFMLSKVGHDVSEEHICVCVLC